MNNLITYYNLPKAMIAPFERFLQEFAGIAYSRRGSAFTVDFSNVVFGDGQYLKSVFHKSFCQWER